MKKLTVCLPFLFLACGNDQEPDQTPDTNHGTEAVQTDKLVGSWQMDSSIFINNGVEGTYEEPLAPTTWTFHESGKYEVKNTMSMSGSWSRRDNQLFVDVMGLKTDYTIVSEDDQHLQLQSTIYEIDTTSMKTRAYLTRIN